MDAFLGHGFVHTVNRLEADTSLLRKILYRNRNQHGNTLAFSYARRISRALSLQWRKEHLLVLQQAVTESFRFRIGETKLTQESVEKLALQGLAVGMTLVTGTKAVHYAIKGYHAYSQLLRKQVFLPLFTVLWSLMARIFKSVKDIVLPLHQAHQHINACIQHIILVSNKYGSILTPQIRNSIAIPKESVSIIECISSKRIDDAELDNEEDVKIDDGVTSNMAEYNDEDVDEGLPTISMDVISNLPVSDDDDEADNDLDDLPPVSAKKSRIDNSRKTKEESSSSKKMIREKIASAGALSEKKTVGSEKVSGKKLTKNVAKLSNDKTLGGGTSSKKRKKDDIDDIFSMF